MILGRSLQTFLLGMIEAGEIFARIDPVEGMVYFADDPNNFTIPTHMAQIEAQVRRYSRWRRGGVR